MTMVDGQQRDRKARGFTLVELLVVGAVISILVAIAIYPLVNALDKSRQGATIGDMRGVASAIEIYLVDNGTLPDLTNDIKGLAKLLAPYQTNDMPTQDHWNHDYGLSIKGNDYTLESYGKDGIDGADMTTETRFEWERDIVLSNGKFTAGPM